MTTFYMATCQDCTTILPMPFRDEAERDAWADAHETIGHGVRRYRRVDQLLATDTGLKIAVD